jgi:DNA-binding CsgD family transcriptional regulator
LLCTRLVTTTMLTDHGRGVRTGTRARPAKREPEPRQGAPELLLQTRLIQLDEASREYAPLRLVWECMATGSWFASESFTTNSRFYFLLRRRAVERPLGGKLGVLLRALLGESQKSLALAINRSNSTITSRLSACLVPMGFRSTASRVPALLVAAAAAAAEGLSSPALVRVTKLDRDGAAHLIVSTARLDAPLAALVTPAEFKVAQLLVDGSTHQEIADSRGSSRRTIANHISAIFRKLGVSGRAELLRYIALNHPPCSGLAV